jgi:hypothetical protein
LVAIVIELGGLQLDAAPEVRSRALFSEKISGVRLSYSADAKALIVSQRSQEQAAVVAALPSRPSEGDSRCMRKDQERHRDDNGQGIQKAWKFGRIPSLAP